MELGLRKAWVEELRRRFAGTQVKIQNRYGYRYGEFREIFLSYDRDDEIRISVLIDGITTQFRVMCNTAWNDEIRWCPGSSGTCFFVKDSEGEVKFELDETPRGRIREVSWDRQSQSSRKGLRPGLKLVNLWGRKGVAPALKN